MIKRFAAIIIALTMCVTGGGILTGCGGKSIGGNGVELDPNKETINVSVYTAGYGGDWLLEYIKDYNSRHTDSKFQFNRIADNTDAVSTITDQINAGLARADIFFNDTPNFQQLMRTGALLDLSSVWAAAPVVDGAVGDTIEDNIIDADLYKNMFTYNDAIYGLPFTQGVGGIVYDHDFVSNDDYDLLFKDPSTASGLTKGRDGIEGTYDDGLPVTVEEFKIFCDKIADLQYLPFGYSDTLNMEMSTMDAMHYLDDGEANFMVTGTYSGTYTKHDGTQIQITPQTGYLAWTEAAESKARAIDFAANFLRKSNYFDSTQHGDHIAAEQYFLYSHNAGQTRIAMHINGFWWEYEARTFFATDAKRNPGGKWGYGERDMRIMPAPIPDMTRAEAVGTADKAVFAAQNDGSVFAVKSKDEEKNKAILEFLTDYAGGYGSEFFAKYVNHVLSYRYEISEETYKGMTPFGKNLYEVVRADNTVILRMDLLKYLEPMNYLATGTNVPKKWGSVINNTSYEAIVAALRNSNDNVSLVKQQNQNRYSADEWTRMYNATVGA